MKVLIAGASGFVGSAACTYLESQGNQVVRLVRREPGTGEVRWDPDSGSIDAASLEGFDGVVNLATMAWPMKWTAKAKEQIRANRLATNGLLASSLAGCARKPRVFICASGMGYYPSSGDAILTEDSPTGTSFLARLQQAGEAATAPASQAGIRVVHLRIPPVLGGQAVRRPGFQAGDGQQWTSWVGRDELARIIGFALTCDTLHGPVNTVSPNPMRNAEFVRVSAKALGRKPGIAMPAFLVRLVAGEMGEEFLLSSRRIQPSKLLAAGYQFTYPNLEDAIRHELGAGFPST